MVDILILLGIGIAFTLFAALVFSVLTLILGKFFDAFAVYGPEGWRFSEFYLRYLIIAAVYTFIAIPFGHGLLGIALAFTALVIAYKFVFDAGWVQALIIGFVGGIIAQVLFALLVVLILVPIGILG